MNTSEPMKPVIVYDGECRYCHWSVRRIQGLDDTSRFEYTPRQTNEIEKRFPFLAQSDFNTGLRLIEEDRGNETVHVGADAVYQIYRRLPPYHLVAWVYRLPVLKQVFRGAYALIARNRHRFGKVTCETAACDVTYSERTVRRT